MLIVKDLMDFADPVRAALVYAESAPVEFASWPPHERLRRLRLRFHLNRKQLAAKTGTSASLIGRAEKGADVRLSTLRRIYAALGCRLVLLPAGGPYELDWSQAHLDNEWLDWKKANARYLAGGDSVSGHSNSPKDSGIHENAISVGAGRAKYPKTQSSRE